MRLLKGNSFEIANAADLLALKMPGSLMPGQFYWIRVESFDEYVEWVTRLKCLGSASVRFSVPQRAVRSIRRWTREQFAIRQRDDAIDGLNPS